MRDGEFVWLDLLIRIDEALWRRHLPAGYSGMPWIMPSAAVSSSSAHAALYGARVDRALLLTLVAVADASSVSCIG